MEAMCDWCGQVVPIGVDGTCFLGHPVTAAPVPIDAAPVDLDIAALPPAPPDTVAPVPDFTAVPPPPLPVPPSPADLGPVPPSLPPQPPEFARTPSAPEPPHAPIMPPPVPAPPTSLPEPVGAFAAPGGAYASAQNPVDAAFAPLINATPPEPAPQPFPGPALPPQAPTGPGWQAVHIADDVAVFEYRPPKAAPPNDDVVAQLPPPNLQPPIPATAPIGADALGAPVGDADVAAFAPGDELDIPDSGSKVRTIVMLAILVVVALGAALAFAFGLI